MAGEKKIYAVGDVLFSAGEVADCLFIVIKGAVSIRKKQGSGDLEVSKGIAGQVIGELSFFDHLSRSESAIAMSYVEAVKLPYTAIQEGYALVPDYLKTVMNCMSDRLRIANELIQKLQDAPGKK